MALIFTDIIAQNGYIGQYIRFVYYFSPLYNVSTWVVIRIYWKIYVPRASGPLDYILQYIRITTHVLYQYISYCLTGQSGICISSYHFCSINDGQYECLEFTSISKNKSKYYFYFSSFIFTYRGSLPYADFGT